MSTNEVISVLMLLTLTGAMLIGFPVAFTLAGVAVLFALGGSLIGQFDMFFFAAVPSRFFGVMTNEILVAVPFRSSLVLTVGSA